MTSRPLRFALVLFSSSWLVAGCIPASAPSTSSQLDWGAIDSFDPVVPVPPPACRDGWQVATLPRVTSVGKAASAVLDKQGVWRVFYPSIHAPVTLRYARSDALQSSESIMPVATYLDEYSVALLGADGLTATDVVTRSDAHRDFVLVSPGPTGFGETELFPYPASSQAYNPMQAATDGGDHTHVVYATDDGLYAWSNAPGPSPTTLITSEVTSPIALFVGADGTRAVLYSAEGGALKYAGDATGSWQNEPVSVPSLGSAVIVGLDATERLQLLYSVTSASGTELHQLVRAPSGWQDSVLPIALPIRDAAAALDGNGAIHVATFAHGALTYATNAGGRWSAPTTIPVPFSELNPIGLQMGIDQTGQVHLLLTWLNESTAPTNPATPGIYYSFLERC